MLQVLNVAEAFRLSPSEAWRELYERNPHGWVSQLLEVRSYRQAWSDLKNDPELKHRRETAWHRQVADDEADLAMEKVRRRGEQHDDE